MSEAAENLHASVVQLGGQGVIIFGPSGSGKSALALELVRQASRDGIAASLVADDRVNVERRENELFASPVPSLAGLIEVRGSGIHAVPHLNETVLRLSVELVKEQSAERLAPKEKRLVAHGLALPALILPQERIDGAVRAILSHLGLYFPLTGRKNID